MDRKQSPTVVESTVVIPGQSGLASIAVRWYDDGSVRMKVKDIGPVYVDELYIHQEEPVIRVRPQERRGE